MGNPVTLLANVRVFATYPHNCSYLPGEQATTLFVDPSTPVDARIYSQLSYIGFRRSGPHLYRPHCAACNACVPARVPVAQFSANRSQRRVLSRNRDLRVDIVEDISSDEHFALYSRYICGRHRDGDMYPPDREQFKAALVGSMPKVLTGEPARLKAMDELAAITGRLAAGTATEKDKARFRVLAPKV